MWYIFIERVRREEYKMCINTTTRSLNLLNVFPVGIFHRDVTRNNYSSSCLETYDIITRYISHLVSKMLPALGTESVDCTNKMMQKVCISFVELITLRDSETDREKEEKKRERQREKNARGGKT